MYDEMTPWKRKEENPEPVLNSSPRRNIETQSCVQSFQAFLFHTPQN